MMGLQAMYESRFARSRRKNRDRGGEGADGVHKISAPDNSRAHDAQAKAEIVIPPGNVETNVVISQGPYALAVIIVRNVGNGSVIFDGKEIAETGVEPGSRSFPGSLEPGRSVVLTLSRRDLTAKSEKGTVLAIQI